MKVWGSILLIICIVLSSCTAESEESERETDQGKEILTDDTLRVVYFQDFEPYSSLSDDDEMHGILIDVLNESLGNRMGMPLSHKGYPWARAQALVRQGEADAFVTVPTPERREYTTISEEPVVSPSYTLFTGRNNPVIDKLQNVKSVSDLSDFSHIQYLGNGWAKTYLADMNIRWVPSLEDVLDQLALNRYDVFVDVSQVTNFNIRKLGYKEKIVEIPNAVSSSAFHLCIRSDSPLTRIIPDFDAVIRQMREDGTLEEIYNRYK